MDEYYECVLPIQPLQLNPENIKINDILYVDKYGEEYKKLTQNNISTIISRNGDICYNFITFELPTSKNYKSTILYALTKYPLPDKPTDFTCIPPTFEPPTKRKNIKYKPLIDNTECVISMMEINKYDEYWECKTCKKCVLYDIFHIYIGDSINKKCPHCRCIINKCDIYMNCSYDINIEKMSHVNYIKIYNMYVSNYNMMVTNYINSVREYNLKIEEYNNKCKEIECLRTQYINSRLISEHLEDVNKYLSTDKKIKKFNNKLEEKTHRKQMYRTNRQISQHARRTK